MADTRARVLHSRPLPFTRNAACYTPMRSPSPWQRPAEPPLRETQGRRQQRPTDSAATVVTERDDNDKSNFLKSGIRAKEVKPDSRRHLQEGNNWRLATQQEAFNAVWHSAFALFDSECPPEVLPDMFLRVRFTGG